MTAASPEIARAGATAGAGPRRARRRAGAWLGFSPFAVYVLLFLAIPAVYAVASGFLNGKGGVTFANFAAFGNPTILKAFVNSILLSAATAVVAAVIGAIICVALLAVRPDGFLRVIVDSASSVLAQFGGVMLAFAFIATMGLQGVLTKFLHDHLGFDIQSLALDKHAGPLLYQTSGIFYPYLYFSIPLMVISFMPAVEGLRPQWGEAVATLGGSRWRYWRHVGLPVLMPAFLGGVVLLFANAFSSFATAAALTNAAVLVPLVMRQDLSSETIAGLSNVPGVLAIGMIVIMVLVMWLYSALQSRAARWQR
jgi:putative spermidine/putrescine transport system permease protein